MLCLNTCNWMTTKFPFVGKIVKKGLVTCFSVIWATAKWWRNMKIMMIIWGPAIIYLMRSPFIKMLWLQIKHEACNVCVKIRCWDVDHFIQVNINGHWIRLGPNSEHSNFTLHFTEQNTNQFWYHHNLIWWEMAVWMRLYNVQTRNIIFHVL